MNCPTFGTGSSAASTRALLNDPCACVCADLSETNSAMALLSSDKSAKVKVQCIDNLRYRVLREER